jgi:hypothetical protein
MSFPSGTQHAHQTATSRQWTLAEGSAHACPAHPAGSNGHSPLLSLACGAIAGAAGTVASYPFDLLRTTLAAQGEPKARGDMCFVLGWVGGWGGGGEQRTGWRKWEGAGARGRARVGGRWGEGGTLYRRV